MNDADNLTSYITLTVDVLLTWCGRRDIITTSTSTTQSMKMQSINACEDQNGGPNSASVVAAE